MEYLKQFWINNHLTFKMKYHKNEATGKYSVVGAAVVPSSVDHTSTSCSETSEIPKLEKLSITAMTETIPWTYSVQWEQSDIRWASRWDSYLVIGNTDDKVHWFSIINSIMIVLFLTGMVAMIMLRALHKDIALYNMADQGEDPTDEIGWKLVHGDIFRKPNMSQLLSIVTGSGVQLIGMALITIVFATLGFVSPSNRGALTSVMLLFFAFMGIFAGYVSLRMYKMFDGEYWKVTSVLTALFFPGIVFVLFLSINFAVFVSSNSSLAVPFTSLLILVSIWVGISIPLVLLGGYFGYSQDVIKNPTKVHKIPRQIPSQVWYVSSPFSILMGGILPFGAVFIELYFIMSSIWLNKFYFVFGFLFVVFFILVITCCEITIVLIYFQLCNADYRWWWRSFLTSASSSFYLFLYSGFYYFTKLSAISHVTMTMVYFGYMGIISFVFFLITGTIGFLACFTFIRIIYGSIKVE
jgi:transmembrane 9 superfamily protein 2/4